MRPSRRVDPRRLAGITVAALLWLAVATAPAAAQAPPADAHPCASLSAPESFVCRAAVDGPGSIIGGAVATSAEAALRAVVEWVVGGAVWLVGQLAGMIGDATQPRLTSAWFTSAYGDMTVVAMLLVLPLLLLSMIQALVRQSPGQMLRAVGVYVPVAAVGTFVAVAVIDQVVAVTDSLSAWVGRSLDTDLAAFAVTVGDALGGMVVGSGGTVGAGLPGLAAVLGALVIAFSAFVIWVLLVLREAAIYVAVLFLPLGFAALVWPVSAHWVKRLAETLTAVILSKFVIVAVLALAGSALGAVGGEGYAVVVSGGALLLLGAFAPFVLLRFIPVFEAGMASTFDGVTTSRTSPVPGPTSAGVYRNVQRARLASAARLGSAAATGGATLAVSAAAAAPAALAAPLRSLGTPSAGPGTTRSSSGPGGGPSPMGATTGGDAPAPAARGAGQAAATSAPTAGGPARGAPPALGTGAPRPTMPPHDPARGPTPAAPPPVHPPASDPRGADPR